jgi:RNA polymerase sigma-70 factor (ECF subfamily)
MVDGKAMRMPSDSSEGLTLDLRAAVVLRDIQGLSTEEVTKVLEILVASLTPRVHRSRIQLRKHPVEYSALSLLTASDMDVESDS